MPPSLRASLCGLMLLTPGTFFGAFKARAEVSVTCVGDEAARRHVIFLRAITIDVGIAESWRLDRYRTGPITVLPVSLYSDKAYYERDFDELGHHIGVRFALVESDRLCTRSLFARCWTGDQPGSIASTYAAIVSAASRVFLLETTTLVLSVFPTADTTRAESSCSALPRIHAG